MTFDTFLLYSTGFIALVYFVLSIVKFTQGKESGSYLLIIGLLWVSYAMHVNTITNLKDTIKFYENKKSVSRYVETHPLDANTARVTYKGISTIVDYRKMAENNATMEEVVNDLIEMVEGE